jgi:hypothetical protein
MFILIYTDIGTKGNLFLCLHLTLIKENTNHALQQILNQALEYGISFPAFWYVFYPFKRVLAVGCVYETSISGNICTHTHIDL